MSRYLDPKADVVFKKIFGDHPHLLQSFLNAVLPLAEGREIISLSYLPNEAVPKIPSLKRMIADVQCVDNEGRVFIVEMQIDWIDSFKQRLLFQSGQAYVKQLEKGKSYHLIKPVYGLGLIATQFDNDPAHWYHHYQLVNVKKPKKEIIEHLQLVFIELPKFPVHSPEEKQLRLLWLRFMREINQKTQEPAPELLAVPEIEEALQLAEEAAYTPAELRAYEKYWDAVSVERTLIEGKTLEALTQGRAEGRTEERALIICQLSASGMQPEQIADITKLSLSQVLEILEKKN